MMKNTISAKNARSASSTITRSLKEQGAHVKQNEVMVGLARAMGYDTKNAMEAAAKAPQNGPFDAATLEVIEKLTQKLQDAAAGDKKAYMHLHDTLSKAQATIPSFYQKTLENNDGRQNLIFEFNMFAAEEADQFQFLPDCTSPASKPRFFDEGETAIKLDDELLSQLLEASIVVNARVHHPESGEYGTPDFANEDGFKRFLDAHGIFFDKDVLVVSIDTGDDSAERVFLEFSVPNALAESVLAEVNN